MFVSTMRKGFHMTFENGLTISVQWGAGNYCQNQHNFDHDNPFGHDMKSKNAEIAIFDEQMTVDFIPTTLAHSPHTTRYIVDIDCFDLVEFEE